MVNMVNRGKWRRQRTERSVPRTAKDGHGMTARRVSKVRALPSQVTPKSRTMSFDFGLQKQHSKSQNCPIATVSLLKDKKKSQWSAKSVSQRRPLTCKCHESLNIKMPFHTQGVQCSVLRKMAHDRCIWMSGSPVLCWTQGVQCSVLRKMAHDRCIWMSGSPVLCWRGGCPSSVEGVKHWSRPGSQEAKLSWQDRKLVPAPRERLTRYQEKGRMWAHSDRIQLKDW